jgi:hypothetical protein
MKKLYNTTEKKVKFLKKVAHIATFKKPITYYGNKFSQILICRFVHDKDGYSVEGMWCSTKVYKTLDELLDRFDWDWMESRHQRQ